jgi:hypothetical protein
MCLLREHTVDVAVDAVTDWDIHQPVFTGDWHGGFRTTYGKGV